nr:MAG TPA: head closure knob [Caudoviricetes sp.]
MKTPHRITLVRGSGVAKYNPVTDSYDNQAEQTEVVPCFVNYIQKAKVFELYGNRSDVVMICRFQREQEPFLYAIYDGFRYEQIDTVEASKCSVRLKRTVRV